MLRFQRDRLYVGIDSDALSFVRIGGNRRSGILDSFSIPLNAKGDDAAVLAALSSALNSSRCAGARAIVTLADHYFRYFIAERPEGTRDIEELEMAAQLRFEDLFGARAADWVIRLDLQPFTSTLLACAIRKSQYEALIRTFGAAGVALESVLPFAVSELRELSRSYSAQDAHLAVINPGGFWYGLRLAGSWRRTYWRAFADSAVGAIRKAVALESMQISNPEVGESLAIIVSGHLCSPDLRESLAQFPAKIRAAETWPAQTFEWSSAYRIALSSMWPRCA